MSDRLRLITMSSSMKLEPDPCPTQVGRTSGGGGQSQRLKGVQLVAHSRSPGLCRS